MHELNYHPESESRYSCDHCQETGIDIESREYCLHCELGKRRMNLDRLAEPLRHHPFTNAMWVAHHSAMKTERAIAAADKALLASQLKWAVSELEKVRAAQPVVLSNERILEIADSEGISFVTDERRPDNATIISFAQSILAAKEQA